MSHLHREHRLEWHMALCERGYTVHELVDVATDVRWGWIVNAGTSGWTAHVGDWGQANDIGQFPAPLKKMLETWETIERAKGWVEETIAKQWRA